MELLVPGGSAEWSSGRTVVMGFVALWAGPPPYLGRGGGCPHLHLLVPEALGADLAWG